VPVVSAPSVELHKDAVSAKNSSGGCRMNFSRSRAAQEAASEGKLDLNRLKQGVGLVPGFVSDKVQISVADRLVPCTVASQMSPYRSRFVKILRDYAFSLVN